MGTAFSPKNESLDKVLIETSEPLPVEVTHFPAAQTVTGVVDVRIVEDATSKFTTTIVASTPAELAGVIVGLAPASLKVELGADGYYKGGMTIGSTGFGTTPPVDLGETTQDAPKA